MTHVLKIQCCQNDINLVDKINEKNDKKIVYYTLKKNAIMFDLYFNFLLSKYDLFKYIGHFLFSGSGANSTFIQQNNKQMISFIEQIDKNDLNIAKKTLLSLYLVGDKSLNIFDKEISLNDLYTENMSHIDAKITYKKKNTSIYFVNTDLIIMYILNQINCIYSILIIDEKNTTLSLNFYKATNILMLFNKLFNLLTFFISIKIGAQASMITPQRISIEFISNIEHFMQKYLKFFNDIFFKDLLDKTITIIQKLSPNRFNDVNNINHYISALMVTILVVNIFVDIFNDFLWSFDLFNFIYIDKTQDFWEKDVYLKFEKNKSSKDFIYMEPIIKNEIKIINDYFLIWRSNLKDNFANILKQISKKDELINIKLGIFCFFKSMPYILNKVKKISKNHPTNQLNILQLQFYNNINYKTININQFRKLKRKYEDIRNIKNKDDIVTDTIVKKNKIEK